MASASSTRERAPSRESPHRRNGSQTLEKTVAQGIRVESWNTKLSAGRPPRQSISPRVGVVRPASSRSAVDLPQPDGPSRDRNSPVAHFDVEALQRLEPVGEHLVDAAQGDERAPTGSDGARLCALAGFSDMRPTRSTGLSTNGIAAKRRAASADRSTDDPPFRAGDEGVRSRMAEILARHRKPVSAPGAFQARRPRRPLGNVYAPSRIVKLARGAAARPQSRRMARRKGDRADAAPLVSPGGAKFARDAACALRRSRRVSCPPTTSPRT